MKLIDYKNKFFIILCVSAMFFVFSILINTLLPAKYEGLILMITIILVGLGLYIKSKTLKVVLSVLFALGSVGMFYTQSVASRLLEYEHFETNSLSFLVLKDSSLDSIDEAKNATYGHAKTLANGEMEYVVNHLFEKYGITMDLTEFNNELDLVSSLMNHDIDVIVIDNAVIPLILDEDELFETKVKIIYSLSYETVKEDVGKDVDVDKDSFVVFISGIDIEGPISLRSRSDVNILMVVNPTKQKILTISIPRDTYVHLGCRTGQKDKLTHAGIYGISCSVNTIEKLFDIEINYYVRVNFTSVIRIVDIMGDIEVYSQHSFSSGGYTFRQGLNTLSSEATLAFSRERYSLPGGDVTRGLNQQEVIKGLVNKLIEPSSLLRIEDIVLSTSSSLDTTIPSADLTRLVRLQLDQQIRWTFGSMHLTGQSDMQPTYSMGDRLLYVMHPDVKSINDIHQKIIETMK